ncbi:MAG TPA: SGNH/GDSL hydrolase family protein [Solirubrobacterales bacterium]|nr:SGNH/GDSL hydrolase family protein [Solirubrobacterales bacterium]
MIKRALLSLLLLATLGPMASGASAAKPAPLEVGRASLGTSAGGHAVVLVPVRYSMQMAGRRVPLAIALLDREGRRVEGRQARVRLSAGRLRSPERRRSFTFVHRLDLRDRQPETLTRGMRVRVHARTRQLSLGSRRSLCSTVPVTRTRPGRRTAVPLPACTSPVRWRVIRQPAHGSARVQEGSLVYRSGARFRGDDSLVLSGGQQVRFTVSSSGGIVVRALGDSVTAGFGYFSNGESMPLEDLLECRPGAKEFNDACSSNSLSRVSKEAKPEYAPGYGLANNVSWAAQWANSHGVTDYKNFAISGSEPKNWAPEGEFHSITEQIFSEDPDYILMTMGANPLLSDMLFGLDEMGCAVYADVLDGYRECIEESFAEVKLREHLKSLYADLVKNTEATIFLMQYHLSVPSTALAYSATQIAMMGKLLNREIASVAAEVGSKQLQVVAPPHFDVGIDISPVYPSRYSCSLLDFKVDGPSVQSTATQDELEVLHPLSFCEGPEGGESPWVISGDTGIHPSANGYAQMASQVPAPVDVPAAISSITRAESLEEMRRVGLRLAQSH